jgi:putative nucleotidyltransferase with HDIG domain
MDGRDNPDMEARFEPATVVVAAGDGRTRSALAELAQTTFPAADVREVRDAAALAEAAAGLEPSPERVLVLLEPELGGVDLRDALGLVQAVHPRAAVVVASVAEDHAAVRVALAAGALACVVIDGDRGRSQAVLRAAAEGHGLVDRDIAGALIERHDTQLENERRRDRGVIASLAAAVEAKDSVTSSHQRVVSRLAVEIARLVEPELAASQDFLFGALLHDVGKIGVPESILSKPGPLDEDEWTVMRGHPATGARVIDPLGLSRVVHDVVLHHHERWDGAGYPHGLGGNEIPMAARIFSVADSLEAMTANRPYRGALSIPVALGRIHVERATQFDPRIVDALGRGIDQGRLDLDAVIDGTAAFPPAPRVVTGPRW